MMGRVRAINLTVSIGLSCAPHRSINSNKTHAAVVVYMCVCVCDVPEWFYDGLCGVVSGSVVGQRLAEHPKVRKLGFTGSTPVGKTIMGTYVTAVVHI